MHDATWKAFRAKRNIIVIIIKKKKKKKKKKIHEGPDRLHDHL